MLLVPRATTRTSSDGDSVHADSADNDDVAKLVKSLHDAGLVDGIAGKPALPFTGGEWEHKLTVDKTIITIQQPCIQVGLGV